MPSTAQPAALSGRRLPNLWDFVALCCVVGALVAVAAAFRGTLVPLDALESTPIDLDPGRLPLEASGSIRWHDTPDASFTGPY